MRTRRRFTRGAVATLMFVTGVLTSAAPVPAAAAQDPAAGGGSVAAVGYDLGDTAFTDPQTGTVSELRAVVHYPRQLTGRLPLIVMAHGSWLACDAQNAVIWPCPAGAHPFPSYCAVRY